MTARYAIGVGARRGVDALELAALVREVATRQRVDPRVATLATLETRADERGVHEAARMLAMDVVFLPLAMLRARDAELLTRSRRVEQMFGVGGIAEGLALAAAGPGGVLLAPRMATARLTCAIARAGEGDQIP